MFASDLYIFISIQAAIVCLFIYSLIKDALIRKYEKDGVEVKRGQKAMVAIGTVYLASIASSLALIDRTSSLEGNKVLFMAVNFLCFTYLFYFSTWFRNSVFFWLYGRAHRN
jgi:hypothetical protein